MQSRTKTQRSSRRQFLNRYVPAGALGCFAAPGLVASAGCESGGAEPANGASGTTDSRMAETFEQMLQRYAEVIVKVGLNLQPGQRLLIVAFIGTEPLVRQITTCAYQADARFVDVIWRDQQLDLLRLQHAPRDSFREFPDWPATATLEYLDRGDAILQIFAEAPDLLSGQDPQLVATSSQAMMEKFGPVMGRISRNGTNWLVVPASVEGWAAKVFPHLPPSQQQTQLWEAIFEMCRLNCAGPVSAWQQHVAALQARCDYLNRKRYARLKYTAPGTDLTVGLPDGHVWSGGRLTSGNGITFIPNLPTEEVWTLPHRDRAEGTVRATKPLSYQGMVIEDFSFRLSQGRIIEVTATRGEAFLKNLIANVEGASRLGEVALVPHSSPISRSGVLYYNALIDENAASHIALGNAYRFSLQGGETMSSQEFAAAGGNESTEHLDFMVGCDELAVAGILADGTTEPIMRKGEWAFTL